MGAAVMSESLCLLRCPNQELTFPLARRTPWQRMARLSHRRRKKLARCPPLAQPMGALASKLQPRPSRQRGVPVAQVACRRVCCCSPAALRKHGVLLATRLNCAIFLPAGPIQVLARLLRVRGRLKRLQIPRPATASARCWLS